MGSTPMHERDNLSSPPPDRDPARPRWDIQGMAEALRAETELVHDVYHGQGVLFHIGLSRSKLAAWQEHGYIEATTEVMQVRMADVAPPGLDDSSVIFYSTTRPGQAVWIDHQGSITAYSAGLSPAPEHLYPERPAAVPVHQPLPESTPGSVEPAPLPSASEPAAPSAEQREKNNRIELLGNVSWEPKFREFQSGNARLQFGVAQHLEDGSTRHHTVKAFGERARRYNSQIHKGDAIHLVGGRATEKSKDKDGNEREREFVILWGLKPLAGRGRAEDK